MRLFAIASMIVLVLAGCGEADDGGREGARRPRERQEDSKRSRVREACKSGTSPVAGREEALRELSRLEPGLGIGPLARLLLAHKGSRQKEAQLFSQLAEACAQY